MLGHGGHGGHGFSLGGHGASDDGTEDVEPEIQRYQLRVVEMDGRRIARIRITRLPEGGVVAAGAGTGEGGGEGGDGGGVGIGPEGSDITWSNHPESDGADPASAGDPASEIPGEPDQSAPRI